MVRDPGLSFILWTGAAGQDRTADKDGAASAVFLRTPA